MATAKIISWRGFFWLLIVSSVLLGLAGGVATTMACGWDFLLHPFEKGHCSVPGSPFHVWLGSVATFGIGMKVFWLAVGIWAVWQARRAS